MATPDSEAAQAITIRYQVTAASARAAWLLVYADWLPWIAGMLIVALLGAVWSPLGDAGKAASVLLPVLLGLWFWRVVAAIRQRLAVYRGRTIELVLDEHGFRCDMGFAQTQMPWTTVRKIVRRRQIWLFDLKTSSRFYVPTDAIPVEARALVARWASQKRVRLA